jgi:hypothetical protein
MTDGGRGEHTSKYYTEAQMEAYSEKLSIANKGRAKPKGFSEHLSRIRKGLGNPASKELKAPLVCFREGKPIRMFKYGFEVNEFIDSPHAYGNVYRNFKKNHSPYGYKWTILSLCTKSEREAVERLYRLQQADASGGGA